MSNKPTDEQRALLDEAATQIIGELEAGLDWLRGTFSAVGQGEQVELKPLSPAGEILTRLSVVAVGVKDGAFQDSEGLLRLAGLLQEATDHLLAAAREGRPAADLAELWPATLPPWELN